MRIARDDYESTFEQLLIKNKTITSHKKNLQCLAIEIYKTFNGLNPTFIDEIFLRIISRKKSQNLHRLIVLLIFARNTLATSVIFDLYYV